MVKRIASLLNPVEFLIGSAALVGTIGLLLFVAFERNHDEQRAAFANEARQVVRVLDDALTEFDALLKPLTAMHFSDTAADDLLARAADLRSQNRSITGFGRFSTVTQTERETFEETLLDSGLYRFRIVDIDAKGHRQARGSARRYYPISLLEPMDPVRLRLLGADLGTIPGLRGALDRTVANDNALITAAPDNWPTPGEMILFRATYRGSHAPLEISERLRQSDGGYWLMFDPAAIFATADIPLDRLDLTLDASDTANDEKRLIERLAAPIDDTVLTSIYAPETRSRRWSVGEGHLVLTVSGKLGVPINLLAGLILLCLLILVLALSALAYVLRSRQASRDHHASQLALHTERERADRTLNAIDDAVIALSAELGVLHLNPAAASLIGGTREAVVGESIRDVFALLYEETGLPFQIDEPLAALDSGGRREIDVVPSSRVGEHRSLVLRMSMSRTHDPSGNVSGYILVFRDISDERRLTRRLEYQANHDALTGCTNRRYFETRLGELIDDMPASGRRHALCYIDLDQFKVVNDTSGHAAGDSLLQELTVRLQSLCRQGDVLSRLGGDEFGLLIIDAQETDARAVADKIHAFFQTCDFSHADQVFAIRASIGFVPLDEESGSIGDVLAAADLACYAAKEGGRNSLYVYSPDDETLNQRSSELNRLPELRRAIDEDRFELHVQAVASIDGADIRDKVTHFEFLLRLTGEDGEPITPFRIIEAAERYGLMREIDRWVIAHAVQHVADMSNGPASACSFSINLSGQSAADPTLIDFIETLYETHAITPERIWFELTETAAISQFSVAVELATRIRSLGSKIALDDFGSGLSSFGYLKNIPVDVLKIDGQFIRNLVDDPVDRTMVRAINDVAKSMGIITVAEFVENAGIVDVLDEIGIDLAQGYHIGKPKPIPEAIATLAETRQPPSGRIAA